MYATRRTAIQTTLVLGVFALIVGGGCRMFDAHRYDHFQDKLAPEIAARTIDGSAWVLGDHRGKVILIDFWAPWCYACVKSMPTLKAIHAEFGGDPEFLMIGVPLDTGSERVTAFIQQHGIAWMQLFEHGEGKKNSMAKAFRIETIPSVWIIDRNGRVSAAGLHRMREVPDAIRAALAKDHTPVSAVGTSLEGPR